MTIADQVRFHGCPIIEMAPGSRISIGEGAVLTSVSQRTALAVNHAVVLRTLRAGASIEIGEDSGISGGSICAAVSISIGRGALLGANVTIIDTDFHPVRAARRRHEPMTNPRLDDAVRIGDNVFLGTGAIILKGTTIGDNAVVGAGAVVRGNVPEGAIVTGNPAREVDRWAPG